MMRIVYQLHKYLGLAAGAVLMLSGLTGVLLVFSNEIEESLYPKLLQVIPGEEYASLETLVARARDAYPDGTPAYVRMPVRASETLVVYMDSDEGPRVFLDPHRATVLGVRGPQDTFRGWLFALHTQLFAGEAGEVVIGSAGLVLLVLSVSGLVLWWPGWRRLVGALRIRGGSWLRTCSDLHRVAGVAILGFLLISGATGAALVFHETFTRALFGLTGTAPLVSPTRVAVAGDPLSLDEIVRRAETAIPEGRVTWLYLPMAADQPVVVRKKLPEETHPNGRNFVYVDPYRGKIMQLRQSRGAALGVRIDNLVYPLHIGVVGGLTTRVIQVAVGMLLAVLFIAGLIMWAMRSRVLRAKLTPRPADGSKGGASVSRRS